MFNDNGPLMFIDSVSTNNLTPNNKKIYDSRTMNILSPNEEKKLSNMVMLYKKNMPVLCKFTCTKGVYEGVVVELTHSFVVIENNSSSKSILKDDILSFMILEF